MPAAWAGPFLTPPLLAEIRVLQPRPPSSTLALRGGGGGGTVLESSAVSPLAFLPYKEALQRHLLLHILAGVGLWAYQNCNRDKCAVQERGTDGSSGK